jgi:hypothetical protein
MNGPVEFSDHKVSRHMLKKLALFAHRMADGHYEWHYTEDVFLMHSYSRLVEQQVRASVGWYLTQVMHCILATY